jgi:hypothetical protein
MTDCRLTEAERVAFRAWLDRPAQHEHWCAVPAERCNCREPSWRDFAPQRIEVVRVEGGWVAVTTPCTCDVCQPKASGT